MQYNLLNLINSFFDFYKSFESGVAGQSKEPIKPNNESFIPLQKNMLSTMKSHDDFVRRVIEKNKKD